MNKPNIVKSIDKKLAKDFIDTSESVLEALVEFDHPSVRDQAEVAKLALEYSGDLAEKMNIVHFPWLDKDIKLPEKDLFRRIRSSRNRNLITPDEQVKLEKFTVGIAGMSVGSNIALAVFIAGMSVEKIKLADADTLSLPNLNRIRSGVGNIGKKKVEIVAQQLYELDPYSEIICFANGVTEENITEFVSGCDVVVDEVDDLKIKIMLRLEAKKLGIPVVMVTDIDYRALLDVERYDLDSDYPLFHGRAGEVTLDTVKDGLTNELRVQLSTSIVGGENLSPRMMASLAEIGKTLPTWPQLGPAAFMAGTVASYAIKEIAIGEISSGRWLLAVDEMVGKE